VTTSGTNARPGRDGEDGGVGLLQQVRRERGDGSDRAQQVDLDNLLARREMTGIVQVLDLHDARHRDYYIEVRVVRGHRLEGGSDRVRVGDVERHALDAVLVGDPVQQVLAAAADDDGVAEIAEPPCQAEAESRRTTGEEDRVASRFHGSRLRESTRGNQVRLSPCSASSG
jgi:hypothetical protein